MSENNPQKLSTQSNNMDECINVVIRVRGKKIDEIGKCTMLNVVDNNSIQVDNKTFYYDYVANMEATQEDMFQHCAKRICDSALKGYNGTIFAYGQTGSGKTFTLLGKKITNVNENKSNLSIDNSNLMDLDPQNVTNNDMSSINDNISNISNINNGKLDNNFIFDINDQDIGLLPRILFYLFKNSPKSEENKYTFKISYLEIYQETISDLLNPDNSKPVLLRDIGSTIILDGLRKLIISSPEEALKYIIKGNKLRHIASTLMNDQSSRSHAVISIYIEKLIKQKGNNAKNKIQKSVFHIIDLAGSERQNKTGAMGERVKEAGAINKSLFHLSVVIKSIIDNQKLIPYRNSKLTHLLRDSLGGNAKTSIIAAVSPFDSNISETLSTLNFAQNAKKVKNHAVVNEELTAVEASAFKEEIKNLKYKYNAIYEENEKLKRELLKHKKNIQNNNTETLKFVNSMDDQLTKMNDQVTQQSNNMKLIQEENAKLKDKNDKIDLEIKLKEKEITHLNNKINELNNEINKLLLERKNYKNQNINLTGQLVSKDDEINKIKTQNKEQMTLMEQNMKQAEQIIHNKEDIINNIKNQMNEYIKQISEKDKQIEDFNTSIKQKDIIINELQSEKQNDIIQNERLLDKLKEHKIQIESKQKEIDDIHIRNKEIKDKGKNLLQKYDESINKYIEEIENLKKTIVEKDNKVENVKKIYSNLEKEKLSIETKLNGASNRINEYLCEISNLNQENRILTSNYELLKKENEQLKNDFELIDNNNQENKLQSKNESFISKKVSFNKNKKSNTKGNSKIIFGNNNQEYNKLKKLYDDLKKNYENVTKLVVTNNSGGIKMKSIQELSEKYVNVENELKECRRIFNSAFNRIIKFMSEIKNSLNFDFNSFNTNYNIEQKFYIAFEKLMDFNIIKEAQLQNMQDQYERLVNKFTLIEEKKELFELNKKKNSNIDPIFKSITKERKDFLYKELSTNTKKIFSNINKNNTTASNDNITTNDINKNTSFSTAPNNIGNVFNFSQNLSNLSSITENELNSPFNLENNINVSNISRGMNNKEIATNKAIQSINMMNIGNNIKK